MTSDVITSSVASHRGHLSDEPDPKSPSIAGRGELRQRQRLDLVSRVQRSGRRDVSSYFTNYAAAQDWHLVPACLDGREVIAVFRNAGDTRPGYFVELTTSDGRITRIKDYRYVPYIAVDADLSMTPPATRP